MLLQTVTTLSFTVASAFSSPLLLPVYAPSVPEISTDTLELTIQDYKKQSETKSKQLNTKEHTAQTEVEKKEKIWKCKGCNQQESYTLEYLQRKGIKDKNALATILGNIKQESNFIPNICEGGARTDYESCRSGGFGIIQFTDAARYDGLGKFAYRTGGNPSSIDTQLKYMLHEVDWKMIEPRMKTPGKSIDQYMYYASKWIRWGHHGARTDFAYRYSNKMYLDS
jgi:hypothetical protein